MPIGDEGRLPSEGVRSANNGAANPPPGSNSFPPRPPSSVTQESPLISASTPRGSHGAARAAARMSHLRRTGSPSAQVSPSAGRTEEGRRLDALENQVSTLAGLVTSLISELRSETGAQRRNPENPSWVHSPVVSATTQQIAGSILHLSTSELAEAQANLGSPP